MLITHKNVEKLKAGKQRLQFFDDDLPGFGVRIQPDEQRSFFWLARVNGKLRFRSLGKFPAVTVDRARTSATRLNGEAAAWRASGYAGIDPFEKQKPIAPAPVPTFREMTEAYIAGQIRSEANRPEKAEKDFRGRLKTHFGGWMDRKVDTLTVEDVLRIKNSSGSHHIAANRCVELVRRVFNWSAGSKDGAINFWKVENIAKDIQLYEEKSRKVFLQPEQLVKFDECLKDEPHADLKDFLTLAMATGSRKSDIFSMRWQDWHQERHIWSVPQSKNGESYDVTLLPSATAVLETRRKKAASSDVYVFPGVGKEKHLMELRKPWDEFRKRADITQIHIHDLRRTVGSYLAINGAPLLQIAAALGHRSMQSTLVYAKLQDQAVRDAREGGRAKMKALTRAAKKRLKARGKNQNALTVGSSS